MKNHFTRSMRLCAFILAATIAFPFMNVFSQTYDRNFQDGKIYLKFKDNVSVNIPVNPDRTVNLENAPFLDGLRQKYEITGLSRPFDLNNDFKLLRTFMLDFQDYENIGVIMEDLRKNPDLEYVEKVSLPTIDFVPNDSLYILAVGSANWNWHLDVIHAEPAWDVTMGSPDIKVAIVDNAVWVDHPDLANKIVLSHDMTQAGNQNSNPPENGDPALWSHGTHTAGLAGAQTNNDIGVASIGFNTSLIGVKCTGDNSPPNSITNGPGGIQWAANNGADIISCSWGNTYFSQTEQNLMNTVYGMGIVIVAAAGNDNLGSSYYPASYNHVIDVASTNEDDLKSDFSNYGPTIDICAPGGYGTSGPQGLMSSTWDYTSYGYYDLYFGTSMSTPIAAGLCGLILAINPNLDPDGVENVLKTTATNIDTLPGNSQWAGLLGAGRIDAFNAVTHTPYEPVANFSTPILEIMPGAVIQFTDLSLGVPDEWSWEFTQGNPTQSSQQNPMVQYNTEGSFAVSLGVTNNFGTDILTIPNYIVVTSTPVPWVLFGASSDYSCNNDTLTFTDQSLYSPTSWLWEFNPATVVFANGTTQASQNPQVKFLAPGYYNVTLTATNANGSATKTIDQMVYIEGIKLNYSDDFENGETSDLVLSANSRAKVKIDHRAAEGGAGYGLHFQGGGLTGGWSGGPFNTTPNQAWNENTNFHGMASNCSVDASGISGVGLTFDLRQTYSVGPKYSWFRVLINGEQVADVYGTTDFNPATNTDPFVTRVFDLSEYGNSFFSITFQSSCYLSDHFYAEGDNAFIDNIMISNTTNVIDGNTVAPGALVYPNPSKGMINISVNGLGKNFTMSIINAQGQELYSREISQYENGHVRQVDLSQLQEGVYVMKLTSDSGVVAKKIMIR
jgi:PKD repeat protein